MITNGFDKAEADGRWPGIFAALGIEAGNGDHVPCPMCGGKDRFRMDNKDGKGTWICNQCGAGDGWKLLQEVLGCDFKGAIYQVAPIISSIPAGCHIAEKPVDPTVLRSMYKGSKPLTGNCLASFYLKMRGLGVFPPALRYHPGILEPESCQKYPAMLATVTLPDGTGATLHRTFLTKTGEKAPVENPKKFMPGVKKLTGGAIQLFEPKNATIGVAEGIETAIACHQLFKMSVWATTSAVLMEAFEPPVNIKRVVVFGDCDRNYTGQAAAYKLANRLVVKNKLAVDVELPSLVGDFLDELNGMP